MTLIGNIATMSDTQKENLTSFTSAKKVKTSRSYVKKPTGLHKPRKRAANDVRPYSAKKTNKVKKSSNPISVSVIIDSDDEETFYIFPNDIPMHSSMLEFTTPEQVASTKSKAKRKQVDTLTKQSTVPENAPVAKRGRPPCKLPVSMSASLSEPGIGASKQGATSKKVPLPKEVHKPKSIAPTPKPASTAAQQVIDRPSSDTTAYKDRSSTNPTTTKPISSQQLVTHSVVQPLAVVCDENEVGRDSGDHILMGPPPSPFFGLKNSVVRPVDRIPISPYTRSPQSTAAAAKGLRIGIADAAETPHSVPSSVTRRITRSSPRKSLQPCKPLTPISQPAKHRGEAAGIAALFSHPPASAPTRSASPANSERRLSIRQTESAFKYRDILVKKTPFFTQVILNSTVGNQKNVLTVKALQELTAVLNNAKYDDTSSAILITGSDNGTFCSGLDLTYLTSGDIHIAARTMSDTLCEFVRAALSFPKPLVAAVNGQAIGCGVAILPLCDVVYASDKATFYTPYTQLGQVPEAGLSCSLSLIIGMALANEMLMAGRMLTALEAYQMGLVAQVFWPTSIMQEVIPRITNMATACSSRVLNATKSLIRSQLRERLLAASHTEASMLTEIWATPECQRNIKVFLEHCMSL